MGLVIRFQDEHQAEIASWKQKNAELLAKMKSKVQGIEVGSFGRLIKGVLVLRYVSYIEIWVKRLPSGYD